MMRTGHEVAPPWLYGRTTHHHQWSGWAHFRFLDIVGWCWMFDQNNHARQHLLMVLSGQSCRVVSFDSVSSRCFIEAMSWWTIGQRAISRCGRGSVAGCDWNASSMLGTTFGANNCRPRFSAGSMDFNQSCNTWIPKPTCRRQMWGLGVCSPWPFRRQKLWYYDISLDRTWVATCASSNRHQWMIASSNKGFIDFIILWSTLSGTRSNEPQETGLSDCIQPRLKMMRRYEKLSPWISEVTPDALEPFVCPTSAETWSMRFLITRCRCCILEGI